MTTMTAEKIVTNNRDMFQSVSEDSTISLLEKAEGGKYLLKISLMHWMSSRDYTKLE
jgi:hypothetical protein